MLECIIAGSGFTGAVAARILAKAGVTVHVIEKRTHIAGNMYDEDMEGILVQKYGPHVFHTKRQKVYDFITSYGDWTPYTLRCQVYMDGKFTPSPFNAKTMDDFLDEEQAGKLRAAIGKAFPGQSKATIVDLLESENPDIRSYAKMLYDKDYSLYTAKQWGIRAEEVDPATLKRVPVRFDYADRYYDDPYECNPSDSYTAFFARLLDHPGIHVTLGKDIRELFVPSAEGKWLCDEQGNLLANIDGRPRSVPILYTGALDDLFNHRYGKLPYRSLRFDYKVMEQDRFQDAPVVAYPQVPDYTRVTEYNQLPLQKPCGKTVLAYEYPLMFDPDEDMEPYYPISSPDNAALYERYLSDTRIWKNFFVGGRLADYKYYYMDDAAARGMELAESILTYMKVENL